MRRTVQPRARKGTPAGGQFAGLNRAEAALTLVEETTAEIAEAQQRRPMFGYVDFEMRAKDTRKHGGRERTVRFAALFGPATIIVAGGHLLTSLYNAIFR